MNRDANVNIKATVNGKEMDPAGVTSLLNVLFQGGWLEEVIRTGLEAPAVAMEQVNETVTERMADLRETLEEALGRAAAAASDESGSAEAAGEPGQGDEA